MLFTLRMAWWFCWRRRENLGGWASVLLSSQVAFHKVFILHELLLWSTTMWPCSLCIRGLQHSHVFDSLSSVRGDSQNPSFLDPLVLLCLGLGSHANGCQCYNRTWKDSVWMELQHASLCVDTIIAVCVRACVSICICACIRTCGVHPWVCVDVCGCACVRVCVLGGDLQYGNHWTSFF